jgi:tRNA A-37 threonylcarbamoyl transferase component Bud32
MKTMVSTAGSGLPGAFEIPDVLVPGAKAGPWIVERELGRGGMGAVYAVVHEEIGKRAALKVVHKRLLLSGFNGDRMLLEAKVVNQVGHPHIVDIFETGKLADDRPYIVMERLDGQSLSARADEGKLLPDLVIAILLQVCDALVAAHAAGVIHRDLKLDNVFLVDNLEDPATPKVKLLDWGIAKLIHHDVKHTVEGQLVGTPQYLSPEQARGLNVTPQTDVYSLGVMAYELFLEQLPFEAETAAEVMAMHLRVPPPPPAELWPDVPVALENLLLAMLAKQADQRPTMQEVGRRLEAIRAELDRRRNTVRTTPRHRTATPIDGSRPNRVISSAGLAETMRASGSQAGTKRWQFAVGLCALAASGMLFWVSRVGDRSASAATTPELTAGSGIVGVTEPTTADRAAAHAVRTPDPREELATDDLSDAVAPRRTPGVRIIPVAARVEPLLVHAAARPLARSAAATESPARTTRPAATRSAPARSTPAAPRRGAKVDPDGTFDPYL